MTYNAYKIFAAIWITIFIILLLASCKTVKHIDKSDTKIDSSLIEQNEGLQQTLHQTIEDYERERQQWLKTGILFDTVYRDTGSLKIIPKVVFDKGKIKSIEGRLLAVNQSLYEKSSELSEAQKRIESLTEENERKDIQLSKKQEVLTREVRKTVWPWWLFGLCILLGLIIEYKFKPVKRFLSLFNFSIMRTVIFFLMACLCLTSCDTFHDDPNTSVWANQLWLVFWIPFLGSLWLYYRAYLSSRSGSLIRKNQDERWQESKKNVPIYKLPKFWIASVLQVFAWAVVWYVNSDFWR